MNLHAIWQRRPSQRRAAEQAQQRQLEADLVPHIPVGLELHLEPSDLLQVVAPAAAMSFHWPVIILAGFTGPIMYRQDVGWLSIWGHGPACGKRPGHDPCITAVCRLGAIFDAMAAT